MSQKFKTLDEIIDECQKREPVKIMPREGGAWVLNDKGNYTWVKGAEQVIPPPAITDQMVEDAWESLQNVMSGISKINDGGD